MGTAKGKYGRFCSLGVEAQITLPTTQAGRTQIREPFRLKLSILMPAYNEATTGGIAVKRVLDIRYPCDVEVVVTNDGSEDNTSEVLATMADRGVTVAAHPGNRSKGSAARSAT